MSQYSVVQGLFGAPQSAQIPPGSARATSGMLRNKVSIYGVNRVLGHPTGRWTRGINSMFLVMIFGVRLKVRSVCLCLLAAAAAISLHASVPPQPAQPAPLRPALHAPRTFANAVPLATKASHPGASQPDDVCPALATPPSTALSGLTRRIFLEDTVPPSSEPLKTAWLQISMKPATHGRPEPPALRNLSTSVANRQRAP
jgi:hypothetical protein